MQKIHSLLLALYLVCLLTSLSFVSVRPVLARQTPADDLNNALTAYQNQLKNYSLVHQQQLTDLSKQIALLNKQTTYQYEQMMVTEGLILDEFQRRQNNSAREQAQLKYFTPRDELATNDSVEKARYWVTYAHEAVAYQAAKVYIFNLYGEGSIRGDARNLVGELGADLSGLRQKVLNADNQVKIAIGTSK